MQMPNAASSGALPIITVMAVGAPWYNRIAVPIGLSLLALMGLGPLLAWRSSSTT